MNDNKRTKKMAKALEQIHRDTPDSGTFTAMAQSQFYINQFTADLAWELIDAAVRRGAG